MEKQKPLISVVLVAIGLFISINIVYFIMAVTFVLGLDISCHNGR